MVVEEVQAAMIRNHRTMRHLVEKEVVVQVVCLVGEMLERLARMVWEEEVGAGVRRVVVVVQVAMVARASSS